MTLTPAALAEARRIGESLAPPRPDEIPQLRVIWDATPVVDEARAS